MLDATQPYERQKKLEVHLGRAKERAKRRLLNVAVPR